MNPTILQLAADLAAGRTTSRKLTEQALARIADPKGEGGRAFIKVWRDQALAAADASDVQRKAGLVSSAASWVTRWCSPSPATNSSARARSSR